MIEAPHLLATGADTARAPVRVSGRDTVGTDGFEPLTDEASGVVAV